MISTNSNCNDKRKGCITTSSDCVIWQGPNIECIDLCTGDSISTVVATLANELCALINAVQINANVDCIVDFINDNEGTIEWTSANEAALEHIQSGDATINDHITLIYKMLCTALECCDKESVVTGDPNDHHEQVSDVTWKSKGVAEITDREYEELIAQGAEIEILTGGSV
tara:strand:- start:4235 stop:4747 length:513 start_codon:yes stop_codon:yes gene_type:complete